MSPKPLPTRRIAWDGVSFQVPRNWELSGYAFRRGATRITLEDDYSLRLEAEWTRTRRFPELETVKRRYQKTALAFADHALTSSTLDSLPTGWTAFLYDMPENRKLLVMLVVASAAGALVFLQLHFGPEDKETPRELATILSQSLAVHQQGLVPWTVYDVDLELPAEFRLASTAFQAGKKEFLFQYGLRKLRLWQFSFADMILREQSKETWAANTLNACKSIRGPHFSPGQEDGGIPAKRSKCLPLGHFDEIGRACFRYVARCEHDVERNTLILWVFNYRCENDLHRLRGRIGPFRLEAATG